MLLFSLLLPVLCATTAWADLIDPCDGTSGPGSYQNLSPPDRDYIRWDDPPDQSYLCQQSNRSAAAAVYRCSDAREVTVAVYSRHGSYAGYSGGELVRGGDELPLRYQPSTGEVYCDGRRMVYDAQSREFVFLEEEEHPSGLVEYGLSVYASRDGSSYDRMSVWLVSAWQEGSDSYWYEVYRAQLEEGTRYLWLTLTDQSSIEILDRDGRYQFDAAGGLSLASVEIIEEEAAAVWAEEEDWWWEPADDDEANDWEESWWTEESDTGSLPSWGTEEPGTGSLPSYRPGEEEGPASLPWGPDEDPADGGAAFPEETGEPDEERVQEKKASGGGTASSGGSSGSSASKAQSGQKASPGKTGRQEAPREASYAPAEAAGPAAALSREVPLWRRAVEPDAMTVLIIAMVLIVMGVRILLEDGGKKRGERSAREAQYARYMSYDRDLRHDRGSEGRGTGRQPRWEDEDTLPPP